MAPSTKFPSLLLKDAPEPFYIPTRAPEAWEIGYSDPAPPSYKTILLVDYLKQFKATWDVEFEDFNSPNVRRRVTLEDPTKYWRSRDCGINLNVTFNDGRYEHMSKMVLYPEDDLLKLRLAKDKGSGPVDDMGSCRMGNAIFAPRRPELTRTWIAIVSPRGD
ncbi:hypothetical protein FA95DRAFT_1553952 [Auriscalpium vulgare]|uniref:Uncharacterized protein n=1 Tax=Auriscalpium vulgare TaxID=40419 RepID=A0ACB8S751_9AGAM|nr:hypothetical protein FA95DRAFT_1553952 [Auriscalpium vulgare]